MILSVVTKMNIWNLMSYSKTEYKKVHWNKFKSGVLHEAKSIKWEVNTGCFCCWHQLGFCWLVGWFVFPFFKQLEKGKIIGTLWWLISQNRLFLLSLSPSSFNIILVNQFWMLEDHREVCYHNHKSIPQWCCSNNPTGQKSFYIWHYKIL